MPVIVNQVVAPLDLLDVVSCSCKAAENCALRKCKWVNEGLSCTEYRFCEGGQSCCNPNNSPDTDEEEDYDCHVNHEEIDG